MAEWAKHRSAKPEEKSIVGSIPTRASRYLGIAQLVERQPPNLHVGGSIPSPRASFRKRGREVYCSRLESGRPQGRQGSNPCASASCHCWGVAKLERRLVLSQDTRRFDPCLPRPNAGVTQLEQSASLRNWKSEVRVLPPVPYSKVLGDIAQPVELRTLNPKVTGSTPVVPTTIMESWRNW